MILLCIALIPLALAGLILMNAGLGRARSAAHSLLAAMAAVSVAMLVYSTLGFSLEGVPGGPVHTFFLAGRSWDWLARQPLGLRAANAAAPQILFQLFAVSVSALIPLGAGADRWRLSASCLSTALLAGITYPLFGHWVWGGGWLTQLPLSRGFLDPGGAAAIHVVGGLTALSVVWIIGPRRGKYAGDGIAPAIPGHNIVYVLFGALLLLPGWIGLNTASALLFANTAPASLFLIVINTVLCAASGLLAALATTRLRFGKPDASLTANGWVSGLVASSAISTCVNPPAAILAGLVAGILVTAAIEFLELRCAIDDPGGAISVHTVAGIWGILAVGIFQHDTRGQLLAQVVGVSTLLGAILPLSYSLNWLLNRFHGQRTDREGERLGLDLHELGSGAYPEFMIHNDDFMNR